MLPSLVSLLEYRQKASTENSLLVNRACSVSHSRTLSTAGFLSRASVTCGVNLCAYLSPEEGGWPTLRIALSTLRCRWSKRSFLRAAAHRACGCLLPNWPTL